MIRILRYVMRVIYASDTYSGPRMKYLIALLGATFYTFITLVILFVITASIIPGFYIAVRTQSLKLPSAPLAIIFTILVSTIIGAVIKEEDVRENSFSKRSLNRAVNFMLIYAIGGIMVAGIIAMKFLVVPK